jgi:hypothetical protein
MYSLSQPIFKVVITTNKTAISGARYAAVVNLNNRLCGFYKIFSKFNGSIELQGTKLMGVSWKIPSFANH